MSNKISEIRAGIKKDGIYLLGPDGFNQLQSEWIKRCGIVDESLEQDLSRANVSYCEHCDYYHVELPND